MSEPKLKPCPFCGNDDQESLLGVLPDSYATVVMCLVCQATGPRVAGKVKAIAAWNRRAG
jgi:Lar family restriction alleviation protein